jgi:acyl-CoA oxidase
MSNDDVEKLQDRLENLLKFFRTAGLGIADGFDFSDVAISSTLGSYDGNVYERLFEATKKSPLNHEEVNKSFHLYLKPLLKSNL